jgi:hypothetical protein
LPKLAGAIIACHNILIDKQVKRREEAIVMTQSVLLASADIKVLHNTISPAYKNNRI